MTVKRKDHAIADGDAGQGEDDDSPLLQPQPKAKVVTKAALAKKVMKKKIQSNQVNINLILKRDPVHFINGRKLSFKDNLKNSMVVDVSILR